MRVMLEQVMLLNAKFIFIRNNILEYNINIRLEYKLNIISEHNLT